MVGDVVIELNKLELNRLKGTKEALETLSSSFRHLVDEIKTPILTLSANFIQLKNEEEIENILHNVDLLEVSVKCILPNGNLDGIHSTKSSPSSDVKHEIDLDSLASNYVDTNANAIWKQPTTLLFHKIQRLMDLCDKVNILSNYIGNVLKHVIDSFQYYSKGIKKVFDKHGFPFGYITSSQKQSENDLQDFLPSGKSISLLGTNTYNNSSFGSLGGNGNGIGGSSSIISNPMLESIVTASASGLGMINKSYNLLGYYGSAELMASIESPTIKAAWQFAMHTFEGFAEARKKTAERLNIDILQNLNNIEKRQLLSKKELDTNQILSII